MQYEAKVPSVQAWNKWAWLRRPSSTSNSPAFIMRPKLGRDPSRVKNLSSPLIRNAALGSRNGRRHDSLPPHEPPPVPLCRDDSRRQIVQSLSLSRLPHLRPRTRFDVGRQDTRPPLPCTDICDSPQMSLGRDHAESSAGRRGARQSSAALRQDWPAWPLPSRGIHYGGGTDNQSPVRQDRLAYHLSLGPTSCSLPPF